MHYSQWTIGEKNSTVIVLKAAILVTHEAQFIAPKSWEP